MHQQPNLHTNNTRESLGFWLLFAGMFCICTAILLHIHPYYFLNDDNYSGYFPILNNGLQNLYAGKGFPTYCIYQAGGMPTMSLSTYSFLYPLTHFSYLVSRFVLNDVYQFHTVFALIHIFGGYIFSYLFFRKENLVPLFAIVAALTFAFCGFNVIALRSQYYIAPTVLFLPLLFYLFTQWKFKIDTIKKFALLAVLLLCFIYSGNIQFFTYTILFSFTYVIVRSRKRIQTAGILALILFLLALAFFPLIVVAQREMEGTYRGGGCEFGDGYLPLLGIPHYSLLPCNWGAAPLFEYNQYFYRGAGVLILLSLIGLVYKIRMRAGMLSKFILAKENILYLFLILTLIFAIGRTGILWSIHSALPVVGSFSSSFKFLLFTQFFGVFIGAKILLTVLRKFKIFNTTVVVTLALVQVLYVCWNLSQMKQAFYTFRYTTPYRAPEWLAHIDTTNTARILPWAAFRSHDLGFEGSLNLNFATRYNVMSISLYEPLIAKLPDFKKYYSEFGVRYFVMSKHKSEYPWEWEEKPHALGLAECTDWEKLDTIYQNNEVTLLEDKNYSPLVELYDSLHQKIPNQFTITEMSDGVIVAVDSISAPGKARTIMLNFFWRPALRVWIDGQEVPVNKDEYGRVICPVVGNIKSVRMRYDPFSWKHLFSEQH